MKAGKRHTLLAFRQRYRHRRALYFVVALALIGLYVLVRLLPSEVSQRFPWQARFDWVLLVLGAIVFVIALFRWIASEIPYVQCTERNLKIQTPLYPIVISYKRIKETRPNPLFQIYRQGKLSRLEQNVVLAEKTGGQTAIVVDMVSWPMSLGYMKLWMSNLLFTPDSRGLVLWVEDWMTLNREISDFKDRWRDRKLGRDEATSASLYGQIMRDK
jgi:hypothetical protein